MGALLIIAALAQAATSGGSTPPSSTDAAASNSPKGETTYVDLEAGVGYSSNPLLSIVNDQGSAFGRAAIHVVHSRVSARSTTVLSGYAEDYTYINHQHSQPSVSLSARQTTAVSEYTRLSFDGSASYQEGGGLDRIVLGLPVVPPPTPGGIVTPPILIPPGGDFLSVTGKVFSVAGHAAADFSLGSRDSLSLSGGVERVVFHSGPTRSNYIRIPLSLGYNRQLTARTYVGARVTADETDYNGPFKSRSITPQLTVRTLLAPRISLDGAIGVAFSRFENGVTTTDSTGLSAQVSLCGQGETSYYCARFFADQQTATTAGPAKSVGGSIDYSKRLDANQTISLSAGLTHYSTPFSVVAARTFSSSTYYRLAGSYSRQLGSRLFGGVNLAARKVTQNGPDPKTDLSASLFIRYRFGDVQ
jgi:hypothetical protein